jgi:chemotaxis signal transduction protein
MDESTRFLVLSLEDGSYAVPINRLLEITVPRGIEKDSDLTPVFEGKIEFRGKRIPVVNAKKLLKLGGKPGAVLLVVKGLKGVIGILVDAVKEIIESDQPPAALPSGVMNPALHAYSGIIRHKGDLILLLNEDGLLQ